MGEEEYLLSYGNAGEFGRFRCAEALTCRRGDRVVARTPRGQEIGFIMRPASPGHGRLLANQFIGQILRRATEGDLELAQRLRQRSQKLFEDGRLFVQELSLPMEILDAEILLDARQAVLHYLRLTDCDPRPLLDALSQRYHLLVALHDLALPSTEGSEEQQELVGCGVDGCGGGGCGSCASKNCSTCVAHRSHHAANGSDSHGPPSDLSVPRIASAVIEPPGRVSLV